MTRPSDPFPRGSEWRKWDLQVHTPFSALNNGFGDDFDAYAKALFERAVDREIAAIGVTDYFSVEGYKRLRSLLEDRPRLEALVGGEVADRAREVLVAPNIEFRTSVIVRRADGSDSRVNFHVLFSNELSPEDIEEHFLRELHFTAEAGRGRPDERWSVTETNLAALGRRLKQQHPPFRDRSDLFVGMMNAVVSHEDITGVLERQASRFRDRFLVLLPADEDLSEIRWDDQGHLVRKLLLQKAHLLLSSNAGTRAFGLGMRHPTVDAFKAEFGSLLPCVHSSDAHDYESIFEPSGERYTWIKADPTFLGLRQILDEPEARVFIGAVPPSLERIARRPTRTIRRIVAGKIAGSALPEAWFNLSLDLSPELSVIIGNKGGGKSALADVIGLVGNTPRHESFSFLRADRFRRPREGKARHFEASIEWMDGTKDGPVTMDGDPRPTSVEKVKYIPQGYLEEICNEIGAGRDSRFYAELQQVIFSHIPPADRLGFGTLDELLNAIGDEGARAIELHVVDLRDINRRIARFEERLEPTYRTSLETRAAERQRELDAHDAARPTEVPPPQEDAAVQERSREITHQLEPKRTELRRIEEEASRLRDEDALLARRRATAERVVSRIRNLAQQVQSALREASDDFQEIGVDAEAVFAVTVTLQPVTDVIQACDDRRAEIAAELDPAAEGGLASRRQALATEVSDLEAQLSAPQRTYQDYLATVERWQAARRAIVGSDRESGSLAHLQKALSDLEEVPAEIRRLQRRRRRIALEIYWEKQRLRQQYARYHEAVQAFLRDHPLAKREGMGLSLRRRSWSVGLRTASDR